MKKLLFILPLLYYSCTDDIVSDIDSIQTENQEQGTMIDSLLTVLTEQQAYIDSLNNAQYIADSLNNLAIQAYIDSLINEGELVDSLLQVYTDSLNTVQAQVSEDQQAYIDSLINAGNISDNIMQTWMVLFIDSLNTIQTQVNEEQQAYLDSLHQDQQAYLDSLHNAQQTTLTALANSAVNTGFVETEVFSGAVTSSWTDVDLSSVVGQKESLVILKYIKNFSSSLGYLWFAVRDNGSDSEYDEDNFGINVGFLHHDAPNSLVLTQTDSNGMIEHKKVDGNQTNVKLSVVYYLNQ